MIAPAPGGCVIDLHVVPGARRAGVLGWHGEALHLAVRSPATGGRANDDVCRLLADTLVVRRTAVELRRGARGRAKRVFVAGIEPDVARQRIEGAMSDR